MPDSEKPQSFELQEFLAKHKFPKGCRIEIIAPTDGDKGLGKTDAKPLLRIIKGNPLDDDQNRDTYQISAHDSSIDLTGIELTECDIYVDRNTRLNKLSLNTTDSQIHVSGRIAELEIHASRDNRPLTDKADIRIINAHVDKLSVSLRDSSVAIVNSALTGVSILRAGNCKTEIKRCEASRIQVTGGDNGGTRIIDTTVADQYKIDTRDKIALYRCKGGGQIITSYNKVTRLEILTPAPSIDIIGHLGGNLLVDVAKHAFIRITATNSPDETGVMVASQSGPSDFGIGLGWSSTNLGPKYYSYAYINRNRTADQGGRNQTIISILHGDYEVATKDVFVGYN